MRLKASLYNHFEQVDDVLYVVNLLHLSVLAIGYETYLCLINNKINDIPSHVLQILRENNIVIEEDFDEIAYIKAVKIQAQFKTNNLTVVIAPTLFCNFKCPYCFEPEKARENCCMMREDIANHSISAIQEYFNQVKFKSLHIVWFGGEPIIGIKRITYMANELVAFCERNNIAYTSEIKTNGVLLSDDIVKKLIEIKVNEISITVDGDAATNDVRRVAKNGKSSFESMLKNIKNAAQYEKIKLIIRTNIDRDTSKSVVKLHNILKTEGIYNKVEVVVGHTSPYEFGKNPQIISGKEFSDIRKSIILERTGCCLGKQEFAPGIGLCAAGEVNHLAIGPKGEMYACPDEFGQSNKVIGNITDHDFVAQKIKHAAKYFTFNMADEEKCKKCKLLALCSRACPIAIWKGVPHDCHPWFYNPSESISAFIRHKLNESKK